MRQANLSQNSWVSLVVIGLLVAFASIGALGGVVLLSSNASGATASFSGLVKIDNELSMLRCDEGEIQKMQTLGIWGCASDSTTSITGANAVALDLSDDDVNEATGITEIASSGDTNGVMSEPSADKLLFDFSNNVPGADTATALAADPSDCAANQFANAIAASGNLTCAAIADADVPNTITIDNAGTADALSVDPADCAAGTFADAIAANGDLTCNAVVTADITDGTILPADLNDGADTPSDEDCLTYEGTGPVFEWQTCGGAGANSFETINASSGTDPVADSSTDTLNVTAGTGITVTGDASTDTITIASTVTDTSANTECAGSQTYLDGEGNCDTLDGMEDFETATDDGLAVGNGSTFDTKVVTDCDDTGGNHLNYDTTTNAFSCGTSGDGTGYNTVQNDGTPLTQRATLNMTGSGVSCLDTGTITECTISSTGGTSTLQEAFDNGQSITVANTDNQTLTVTQNDVTNNPDAVQITNAGTGNALQIDQNGNTGTTLSSSGALAVDCTDNAGICTNIYSNAGAGSNELLRVTADNAAFDDPAVYIRCDGTGGACAEMALEGPNPDIEFIESDQATPAGKFEIAGQGDRFQINGRDAGDTAFESIVEIARMALGGLVTFFGDVLLDNEGELRWGEADGNGTDYIAVKAPAAITSTQTCTLEDDSTPFDSCVTANPDSLDDLEAPNDDTVMVGNGSIFENRPIPNCTDTNGQHLNYTTSTNVISCGVSANVDSFRTINAPAGSDPVADSSTDTLSYTSSNGTVGITGNSVSDSIDFDAVDVNCTGCLSTAEVAGLDISDDTNLTAGRSLTLTDDDVFADAELYTVKKSINIISPTTSETNKAQYEYATAATITEVSCSTDTGTVTIQLDERARATPNTAGTDVMTSTLVCDTDSQTTTTFTNAGIAADVPVNLQITATSGTPGVVRIHVEATKDD